MWEVDLSSRLQMMVYKYEMASNSSVRCDLLDEGSTTGNVCVKLAQNV